MSIPVERSLLRLCIRRASSTLRILLLALPLSAQAADEPAEPPFYAELALNAYAGNGRFTQEAYLDLSLSDTVSVWANPYREPGYTSATVGLAKTVGHWTLALGAGQYRSEGVRVNIVAPWLSYNSDKHELLLSVERYGSGEPSFWQGYAQRRVGRHFIGVYGETDFGIGPAATFAFNDHLRLRLAVPVAERGDAKALVTAILVP